MQIKTSITQIKDGQEFIRKQPLTELIKEHSFAAVIFLLLKGKLPNETEEKMMNALFVAAIDHGPGTASGQVSRIVASAKSSLHVCVSAGILAMGERHGSAIEGAAKFFQTHKETEDVDALAKDLKAQKVRVPGYGHAVLSTDHRSETLFDLAKDVGLFGAHSQFALDFYSALNAVSSKQLPINIDGSMAAILSDMGFDWQLMKGFFMIARVPGLVAQSYEELRNDVGLRRLSERDVLFVDEA